MRKHHITVVAPAERDAGFLVGIDQANGMGQDQDKNAFWAERRAHWLEAIRASEQEGGPRFLIAKREAAVVGYLVIGETVDLAVHPRQSSFEWDVAGHLLRRAGIELPPVKLSEPDISMALIAAG
jgi:hypothetical protein